MKPFILFITGSSASGKTTLYESLQTDAALTGLEFHDMDENGVPAVGRGPWRAFRAQELLYAAGRAHDEGRSSIICGNVQPHEIIESVYFKQAYNVHFLYLEIPLSALRARTKERIREHEARGTFDESFNKSGYARVVQSNREFARRVKVSVLNQKNGHVLRTGRLTKAEMHAAAVRLTKEISH